MQWLPPISNHMRIWRKTFGILGVLAFWLVGIVAVLAAHGMYITSKVPVGLLGSLFVHVDGWDRGYFSAEGTWTIDGHNHAFPINLSKYTCYRDEKTCYEAQARIVSNKFLDAEFDVFTITKWDDSTLEFVNSAGCVNYIYAVNRRTEKMTGRRELKKPLGSDCKTDILELDLRLSLVNGRDVVQRLENEASPNVISAATAAIWTVLMLLWTVRIVRAA